MRLLLIVCEFLSYYPLKQGLKRNININNQQNELNFYPTIH